MARKMRSRKDPIRYVNLLTVIYWYVPLPAVYIVSGYSIQSAMNYFSTIKLERKSTDTNRGYLIYEFWLDINPTNEQSGKCSYIIGKWSPGLSFLSKRETFIKTGFLYLKSFLDSCTSSKQDVNESTALDRDGIGHSEWPILNSIQSLEPSPTE